MFEQAHVQLAGIIRGGDEAGHLVFGITPQEGPPLYGEYFEIFEENGNDFNIEIGMFGYVNDESVGTTHPYFRAAFPAEDCLAVERLIRSFFRPTLCFPCPSERDFWEAFVSGQIGSSRKASSGADSGCAELVLIQFHRG
jgi:hypothetical protein